MDIPEQCLWFCGHVTALTGVHCTLLNILTKDFAIPPFQNGCALDAGDCSASHTHLYGTYEAQRWAGKYIYYCPRGLVFCAVIPQMPGPPAEHCMIIGPVIMTNSLEDPFDDPLNDPDSFALWLKTAPQVVPMGGFDFGLLPSSPRPRSRVHELMGLSAEDIKKYGNI